MSTLVVILAVLVVIPGVLVALHLTTLTLASLAYREPPLDATARATRFLVLIPAHNEEDDICLTLSAIEAARRPDDKVLVVADHCTDETVNIARAFGAFVLERPSHTRPGRAEARQDGVNHALGIAGWDAIVMIDADSLVEPNFFLTLRRWFSAGAQALQVRSEARPGSGFLTQATIAAFAVQGVTIPRGRDRLGFSVRLKGSGLVLTRELIARHRFRGPGASEDLWLSLDLCLDGILPRHVDSTRLRSESARTLKAASGQRVRWEAGRLLAAREFVVPLLQHHDLAALEAALHLVTPPLAMAMLSLCLGAALFALGGAGAPALVAVGLLACLAIDVAIALAEADARPSTWAALLTAPAYIVWKAWLQLRATGRVLQREPAFPPTPRDS